MWHQHTLTLPAYARGFHLITREIEREVTALREYRVGLMHLLLQHTSAGLTLNENADPTVRADFERYFNRAVPEHQPDFEHTYEGPDDMPAHLKSSLLGTSLTIPITQGQLNLGTWQGIYLCEHRNHGGRRRIVVTLQGE